MKNLILPALLLLGLAFSNETFAQRATPKATTRQVHQQKRIRHGVKNGDLTKKEAVGLQAQQVHINRTKKRAKADGTVTRAERRQINRKQNRASKNIAIQKHDPQTR